MESFIQMLKEASTEWEFWSTVITSFVAVIALFQTNKQTKLSNKQHLFDRRISAYLFVESLVRRYEEVHSDRKIEKDLEELTLCVDFVYLLNHPYFEKAMDTIDSTIDTGRNAELFRIRNDMRNKAEELELIFSGIEAEQLSTFVKCYEDLLKHLYLRIRYCRDQRRAEDQRSSVKDNFDALEQAYKSIRQSFELQKENCSLERIKKQIKL